MSTQVSRLVCLIRPLAGDSDPEVRHYTDSDIRAFIAVVAPSMPFPVTAIDQFTIKEDLAPEEISRLSVECAILLIGGQPKEFSYKTPVLSVKRVHDGTAGRLAGLWALLDMLGDPAVSWDDEINKIIDDCDRYMTALSGSSDG